MSTVLYLRAIDVPFTGTPPVNAENSIALPVGSHRSPIGLSNRNLSLLTVNGTTINNTVVNTVSNTQHYDDYFARFIFRLGAQSIPAQTWTIGFAAYAGTKAQTQLKISLYVWRPSTGAVVGYIWDDHATALGAKWVGNSNIPLGYVVNFAGKAITVADGDFLCLEIWEHHKASTAKAFGQHFVFDGSTAIANNVSNSSPKAYLSSPATLISFAVSDSGSASGTATASGTPDVVRSPIRNASALASGDAYASGVGDNFSIHYQIGSGSCQGSAVASAVAGTSSAALLAASILDWDTAINDPAKMQTILLDEMLVAIPISKLTDPSMIWQAVAGYPNLKKINLSSQCIIDYMARPVVGFQTGYINGRKIHDLMKSKTECNGNIQSFYWNHAARDLYVYTLGDINLNTAQCFAWVEFPHSNHPVHFNRRWYEPRIITDSSAFQTDVEVDGKYFIVRALTGGELRFINADKYYDVIGKQFEFRFGRHRLLHGINTSQGVMLYEQYKQIRNSLCGQVARGDDFFTAEFTTPVARLDVPLLPFTCDEIVPAGADPLQVAYPNISPDSIGRRQPVSIGRDDTPSAKGYQTVTGSFSGSGWGSPFWTHSPVVLTPTPPNDLLLGRGKSFTSNSDWQKGNGWTATSQNCICTPNDVGGSVVNTPTIWTRGQGWTQNNAGADFNPLFPEPPAQIQTNGNFSSGLFHWTGSTGWTGTSGVARHGAGAGSGNLTSQDAFPAAGRKYKLIFSVVRCLGGSVTVSCGGVALGTYNFAQQNITVIFQASSTAPLTFTPSLDFDGDLDNVFFWLVIDGSALTVTLSDPAAPVIGVQYKLTFTIANYQTGIVSAGVGGRVVPSCGGVTLDNNYSNNGTYVVNFVAGTSSPLIFTADTNFCGSVLFVKLEPILDNSQLLYIHGNPITAGHNYRMIFDLMQADSVTPVTGVLSVAAAGSIVQSFVGAATGIMIHFTADASGSISFNPDEKFTGAIDNVFLWEETGGQTDPLVGTHVISVDKGYRLRFTVQNLSAGNISPSCGGVDLDGISTNGNFEQIFVTLDTSPLQFDCSDSFDGQITNIILERITGDPRKDFKKASRGILVDVGTASGTGWVGQKYKIHTCIRDHEDGTVYGIDGISGVYRQTGSNIVRLEPADYTVTDEVSGEYSTLITINAFVEDGDEIRFMGNWLDGGRFNPVGLSGALTRAYDLILQFLVLFAKINVDEIDVESFTAKGQSKILNGNQYFGKLIPPAWDDVVRFRWEEQITVDEAIQLLLKGLRATLQENADGKISLVLLDAKPTGSEMVLLEADIADFVDTLGIQNMVARAEVLYRFNPAENTYAVTRNSDTTIAADGTVCANNYAQALSGWERTGDSTKVETENQTGGAYIETIQTALVNLIPASLLAAAYYACWMRDSVQYKLTDILGKTIGLQNGSRLLIKRSRALGGALNRKVLWVSGVGSNPSSSRASVNATEAI